MKAIFQDRYGLPEHVLTLGEVDRPQMKDDEVLVRVHAAGAHIGDWLVIRGMPYPGRLMFGLRKPKNRVPGSEVAGRVDAVGKSVTSLSVGDDVFGWCTGAFAEYVAVPATALVLRPTNITLEQAAGLPISGMAALQALRDAGKAQSGQRILVIGASGGVGTFTVQIAKALGLEVTGVCATRNLDLVRSLGADHLIDYTRERIADGGRLYDLVLDLAGNRTLPELRSTLTPTGTLVIVGGSGGPWLMGTGRSLKAMVLAPFVKQALRPFISAPSGADLVVLKELVESARVTPLIDRTYSLDETPRALTYVGERHTRGKVIIAG